MQSGLRDWGPPIFLMLLFRDTSPPAQANDVEIVCQSQEYTNYAEWIEG